MDIILTEAQIKRLIFEQQADTKKADVVTDNVKVFFDTLNSIASSGELTQQEKGQMAFQKNVETIQIGLVLLGYQLPKYGIDGLFGPETGAAINSFKQNNNLKTDNIAVVTPDMVNLMIKQLMGKNIRPEDIQPYTNLNKEFKFGGSTDDEFYKSLLEAFGAPISEENMKFLYGWRQAEGGKAKYNPFNTTLNMPGAISINDHGVKTYPNLNTGFAATVKTLKNPRYSCITNGLINDIGADNIARCPSLKTWGTGDLAGKVIAAYNSGATPKPQSIA